MAVLQDMPVSPWTENLDFASINEFLLFHLRECRGGGILRVWLAWVLFGLGQHALDKVPDVLVGLLGALERDPVAGLLD